MKRRLVIVLGMHRSGTSVITRGLRVLGVELGDRMMQPIEGNNAKGFWEDIDLNALNIEMLNAINSDWCYLSPIQPNNVEALRNKGYFLRAVNLLQRKVVSVPVFGIKDPRTTKLLPFWKEVFRHCQFDISYVVALRHPFSVVKSLAKRDGIDAEQGYLLWLGHVITSLVDSAGDKRVLVDYDLLMQRPDHELSRIGNILDLNIDPIELHNYKSVFLDQSLRHTVYHLKDLPLDGACPPLAREIYAILLEVASDNVQLDDSALKQNIEYWSTEFMRNHTSLTLADRLYTQKIAAVQLVAERDGQIISLNQAIAKRNEQITTLNQAVTDRDGEIIRLNQTVAEWDGRVSSLVAERDHILNSKSWKITKPLRFIWRNTVSKPFSRLRRILNVL